MTLYKFTLYNDKYTYVYAGSFEAAIRTYRKSFEDMEIKSIEELYIFRDSILVQED